MKKLISLALVLSMTLLCIPTFSSAAGYGENIALGKESIASGIFSEGYAKEKINDGNVGSTAALGSNPIISGPRNGLREWVGVDLGEKYDIDAVIVRTRRDLRDDWGRLIGGVYVANKEDFTDMVLIGKKTVAGEFGSDLEIEFDEPITGRYVFITGGAGAYGELEVYGKKYIPFIDGVYDDVPEKYTNAVRIASKLGIMKGVKNGKFGADNLVTRAEAASIANQIMGGAKGTYNGEFADVSANHQYAADIASALNLGIISKADKFRPDDYITSYELFAIMMRISGFYATSKDGEWYNDVMTLASFYGLSDGIDTKNEYINRGDVAMAVYNLLMGGYVKIDFSDNSYEMSENSFLEDKFDMEFGEGVVTANSVTSLSASAFKGDGYIKIGSDEYSLDDPSKGDGLLGKAVYYLTDDDDELVDIWLNTKKTKSVEIESKDIDSTSKTSIKTTVDGKSVNYKIDSNAYYLKNGVAYANIRYNSLAPKYGSVRLIDNDGDNVYEVVELRSADIIALNAISYDENEQKIILSGKDNYKKTIKYDTVVVYDENGMISDFASIKTGNVLYAYISDDGKYAELQMHKGSVSGVVSQLDEDMLVIDGDEYEVSDFFADNEKADIKLGGSYTFLLNNLGEIVYISEESNFIQTEQLAVVTKCYENPDDETVNFKVYSQDGKFLELTAARKCKVDGSNFDSATFRRLGKEYFLSKPVIIKINANNEITTMTTPASERLAPRTESIAGCRVGTAGFFSGSTLVLPTCHDTVSFRVPVDSSQNPKTDDTYLINYGVSTLAKRYPKSRNELSTSEKVLLYGSDENGLPLAAITQIAYGDTSGYGTITTLENWNTVVVDTVSEIVTSNGDRQYRITGWDLTSGAVKEITTDTNLTSVINTFKAKNFNLYDPDSVPEDSRPSSASDGKYFQDVYLWRANMVNEYFLEPITNIKRGDVIRYGFLNGNKNIEQLEIVIKYDKLDELTATIPYSAGDLPSTIFSSYRLQFATITSCTNGRIHLSLPNGNTENLSLEDFSGSLIIFDGKFAEKHNINEAEGYIGSGEKALIFSTAAVHKSIIVMK